MIPKIMHVTWFGPKAIQWKYEKEVREMYSSDYEIKVWTGESLDFVEDNDFVKFAKRLGKWVFVNDYYRVKILEKYGGVYIDTDMLPIKKLDEYLLEKDFLMGYEFRNFITTGFCAVVPNSEFTKRMVDYYDSIINPDFVPLSNLLATEVVYSIYPDIGVANKNKELHNGYLLNRRAFGLWKESKRGTVYFAHKHDSGWINNKFQKWLLEFSANFSKLTPAFVTTIMSSWQNHMTNYRYKKGLSGEADIVINDSDYLKKDDFYRIINSGKFANVTLNDCSDLLRVTLSKLINVKKIKVKNEYKLKNVKFEAVNFNVGKSNVLKYKTNFRARFEPYHNIINKQFIKLDINEILIK